MSTLHNQGKTHLLMNSSVVLYQALLVPFCKEFCGQRPMSHWQALSSDFATQSVCIEINRHQIWVTHHLPPFAAEKLLIPLIHTYVCILWGTPSKNVVKSSGSEHQHGRLVARSSPCGCCGLHSAIVAIVLWDGLGALPCLR